MWWLFCFLLLWLQFIVVVVVLVVQMHFACFFGGLFYCFVVCRCCVGYCGVSDCVMVFIHSGGKSVLVLVVVAAVIQGGHFVGDLFLLRGFSRQSLEKKIFSFRVGSSCKRWTVHQLRSKACVCSRGQKHFKLLRCPWQVLTQGHG